MEIPRFCYHERLSIAGNCRMCLVEVAGHAEAAGLVRHGRQRPAAQQGGSPKVITTTSPMVKKAREGVMEFLLINHPLDCPICDQGGECDLQDQAMAYGVGGSRYAENKRAVEEKYMGPLIKTVMTRCIQCTRCVRFMTEVAGVEEIGVIGRGEDMEITTYLERGMMSELSANVVDLCPVGALTHRPWAFTAGPGSCSKTESVDVMDALGSAIRVDTRGREVMRILPRNNDAVNEEWISDKTRHVADGLRASASTGPTCARTAGWRRRAGTRRWPLVAAKLKATRARADRRHRRRPADAEEMIALKDLFGALGVQNLDCRQDGAKLDRRSGARASCSTPPSRASSRPTPSCWSAPIRASRRRCSTPASASAGGRAGCSVGVIGEQADLTYPYEYLGAGPQTLKEVLDGKHSFADVLRDAKRPMVIVGAGAVARAGRRGGAGGGGEAGAAGRSRQGRGLERLQRAAHGGCPRRRPRPGLRAGRAAGDVGGMLTAAGAATSTCCSCWAPTRSTCRRWARPSSSIWAATATPARSAPT